MQLGSKQSNPLVHRVRFFVLDMKFLFGVDEELRFFPKNA